MKPDFKPGRNIAIKVPVHEFDKTVSFYRDILSFEVLDTETENALESVAFKFGDKTLWIDKVSGLSQAEIWLEIRTDDVEKAAEYFSEKGVKRRNEIESLPEGFKGFWITNNANIIHLVSE